MIITRTAGKAKPASETGGNEIKRPLCLIAGGFVLGEAAVLLSETVGHGNLFGFTSLSVIEGLAGLIALLVFMALSGFKRQTEALSGLKRPGHGGRRFCVRCLPLLLVLSFVLFGMSGAGFAQQGRGKREQLCRRLDGAYVTLEGRLAGMEGSKDKVRLLLDDGVAYAVGNGGRAGIARAGDGAGNGAGERAGAGFRPGSFGGSKVSGLPRVQAELRFPQSGGDLDFRRKMSKSVGKEWGKARLDAIKTGMRIQVKGRLELFPAARNPGEFDYRSYAWAKGTGCRISAEEVRPADGNDSPLFHLLSVIRTKAKENIRMAAGPETAGILTAAVLGDKEELDAGIRDLYQKNGIAHLLAISGLHLSILGMGFYRILRKAGLGYGAAGAAGGVFILCYGVMTGASPSAIRAVTMMSAGFLAAWLGRTYDLLSGAALAAVLLTWKEPRLLTQGGFQLSFGAVFAVGGVFPILREFLGRDRKWLEPLLVSAAIQLVTLPVILYHFYQFPVYGIFLNLLVIPLMGGVICSGLGASVLGGFTLGGGPPVFGMAAAGLGGSILRFYEWLCRSAERLPFHTVVMGRPSAGALILYYGILAGGLFMLAGSGGNSRVSRISGRRLWGRAALLTGLCVFTPFIFLPGAVKGMEAVFLDVGQGDGILIRSGRKAILVDGGSDSEKNLGRYRLEPCLKSYGISEVEYAFITHGDMAHISGVQYLLESCREITIKNLILPGREREDPVLTGLAALAKKRGAGVHYIKVGDQFQSGGVRFTCLYPGPADITGDEEEESAVLKTDFGNCHILFAGDMSGRDEERMMEAYADSSGLLSEIQILKTAHYGSGYSTGGAFLDAMGVRWAVLSYGRGNSGGCPHEDVLERFRERGITVYETAKAGAVFMKTDGKTVKWRPFLD